MSPLITSFWEAGRWILSLEEIMDNHDENFQNELERYVIENRDSHPYQRNENMMFALLARIEHYFFEMNNE